MGEIQTKFDFSGRNSNLCRHRRFHHSHTFVMEIGYGIAPVAVGAASDACKLMR
jgi:hypothetical protein